MVWKYLHTIYERRIYAALKYAEDLTHWEGVERHEGEFGKDEAFLSNKHCFKKFSSITYSSEPYFKFWSKYIQIELKSTNVRKKLSSSFKRFCLLVYISGVFTVHCVSSQPHAGSPFCFLFRLQQFCSELFWPSSLSSILVWVHFYPTAITRLVHSILEEVLSIFSSYWFLSQLLENQDILKMLLSAILWAASTLRLLIFSLPLTLAILFSSQFVLVPESLDFEFLNFILLTIASFSIAITSSLKTQFILFWSFCDIIIWSFLPS